MLNKEAPLTDTAIVNTIQDGRRVIIEASGALDISNCEEFANELKQASETAEDLIVDFRDTIFIDSAIVQYLASAAVKFINLGKRLEVIVADGSYPQRVIKTVRFDQLMDVVAV